MFKAETSSHVSNDSESQIPDGRDKCDVGFAHLDIQA